MKHLLSLLFASLIALFSIGQINKKQIPDRLNSDAIKAFEGKTIRGIDIDEYYATNTLPSSITTHSEKEVKQQLDSSIQKSVGSPYIYYRKIYNYDTHGNIVRERTDETMSNFKRYSDTKSEFIYDLFENCTQTTTYNWDQALNQYVGYQRIDKQFDSKGQMTQEIRYNWNVTLSQWVESYKHEYHLKTVGKDTLSLGYVWDTNTGQWVNNSKTVKTYDSQGQSTLIIWFDWDKDISQWINSAKEENVYDAQGNTIKFTLYRWNLNYNKWDYDLRMEYSFNDMGKLTRRTGYTVNNYGALRVLDRWDYTYGSDGKTVEILVSWDRMGSGRLYTDTKIEEEYDAYGYCIHSKKYRIIEPDQWQLKDYVDYYYSAIVNSGISNPTTDVIKTFPNPATEHITFHLAESAQPAMIELYDIQGKKLISQILASDHRVGVAHLKSGMYFYKLIQNKKIFQGKVRVK